MATPSEAELQAQWKSITYLFDELLTYAGVTSTVNWVTREDAYVQLLETNYPAEALDPIRATRAAIDAALRTYSDALAPVLREYGRVMAAPETDLPSLAFRLYQHLKDNTATVKSRGITFGTPTFSGATGNGTINRLTKDRNNYDIEGIFLDAKVAECSEDQSTGTNKHQEAFIIRGAAPARDSLLVAGSGLVQRHVCLSAADSILTNASFDDFSGTIGTLTELIGWTPTTALSNFTLDQTNYYRSSPGSTTPASLKISANDTMTQALSVSGRTIDPNVPLYAQIAYNRQVGTGDGTLTLTFGSQTATVALAAQTGWNILRITIGQKNWYDTFKEDDLDFKIGLSSRTTGYVLVDDFVIAPYTAHDNTWYAIVGGSTPFLTRDKATWTDALAGSDSKLQKWMWRATGLYLPHDSSPSITDP